MHHLKSLLDQPLVSVNVIDCLKNIALTTINVLVFGYN